MTVLLLIKPCNISPRLLFVPARQLMSPTLSQQETKAQRTHCTLRSLRPLVEPVRRKLCFQNDGFALTPGRGTEKSKQPSSSSCIYHELDLLFHPFTSQPLMRANGSVLLPPQIPGKGSWQALSPSADKVYYIFWANETQRPSSSCHPSYSWWWVLDNYTSSVKKKQQKTNHKYFRAFRCFKI